MRRTDLPLIALSLVFLGTLVLPLAVTDLSPGAERAIAVGSLVIWVVFAADYVTRLYLAPHRPAFVRRHVPDLVIVLVPMLRPLRAARVLRLLRLAGVAGRVSTASRRSLHTRVAAYVAVLTALATVLAAVAVVEVEEDRADATITSFGDALWWAATTVTTGGGDAHPVTALGRVIAFGLILVGLALLGVVTAAVAAWFVQRLAAVRAETAVSAGETRAVLDALDDIRTRLERLESGG